MKSDWQRRLDAAFYKYFAMSTLLQNDVEALLKDDDDSQSSRRNFICASASLIEGYAHCFRAMCEVGVETRAGPLDAKEVLVIRDERAFGAADRVKYTLRATYKLFQLPAVPQFSQQGWSDAQALLDKRDSLMHPKNVGDLAVGDEAWQRIHKGAVWLFGELFGFMSQLAKVHGT